MKTLVKQFLNEELDRRSFTSGMLALGFSAAATESVLTSVAAAQGSDDPELSYKIEGTGGDILVENLKAAGIRNIFSTTATGMTTTSICSSRT